MLISQAINTPSDFIGKVGWPKLRHHWLQNMSIILSVVGWYNPNKQGEFFSGPTGSRRTLDAVLAPVLTPAFPITTDKDHCSDWYLQSEAMVINFN